MKMVAGLACAFESHNGKKPNCVAPAAQSSVHVTVPILKIQAVGRQSSSLSLPSSRLQEALPHGSRAFLMRAETELRVTHVEGLSTECQTVSSSGASTSR